MITFVVLASLMVVVALCFVLPPLWRGGNLGAPARSSLNRTLYEDKLRELEEDLRQGTLAPEQFEQGKQDLERTLLRDNRAADEEPTLPAAPRRRWLVPVIGLAVVLAAGGLYLGLGAHTVVMNNAPAVASESSMPSPHPGITPGATTTDAQGRADPIDEATVRLAKRLLSNPNDPDGWLLLGRSYQFLKRYAEAESAIARAIALGKNDPATKALQAEVHALAVANPAAGSSQTDTAGAGGAEMPVGGKAVADIDEMTKHLQQQPDDGAGWAALARAYQAQHRYLDAAGAYAKATALVTSDAELWAEYADTLAAANGKQFNAQSTALIEKALAINPDQPMALWLAATAALQRGDKDTALKQWLHLQKLLPPDSEDARIVAANIAEVKGEPVAQPQMAQGQGSAPAAEKPAGGGGVTVRGVVSITPELAKEMKPGDTLFIFAKASNGPPMPLAVLRKKAGDLPVQFELDDSMSMMPAAKLSNFPEIIVGARISKSGSPLPSSGDLEGTSGVVKVGDNHLIRIVIDHRV